MTRGCTHLLWCAWRQLLLVQCSLYRVFGTDLSGIPSNLYQQPDLEFATQHKNEAVMITSLVSITLTYKQGYMVDVVLVAWGPAVVQFLPPIHCLIKYNMSL
jgi:hypothetical protein